MSAQQSSTGGVASRISIGDEMYLAYSHVRIGDHFYYGLGVQQDYEIAAKFYLAAANKENPEALFNLGYMYHTGIGIPKDFPLAKRYIVSCRALNISVITIWLWNITTLVWRCILPYIGFLQKWHLKILLSISETPLLL